MTKHREISRTSTAPLKKLPCKRSNGSCIEVASTQTKGPALICEDITDFLQLKCQAYRGLLVQRPQNHGDIQQHVDKLAKSGAFNEEYESSVQEVVDIPLGTERERLALDLSKKARNLATLAVQAGLPKHLGLQIEQDFEQIGSVLTELVPTCRKVYLNLSLVGENSCSRWHRDNYVGRGVVTYNSCGTQYAGHDPVYMEQLQHRGLKPGTVPDQSPILSANIGDILFIKGTKFPAAPNGLVHRSPPTRWHANGTVVNRLLLKVDLD